MDILLQNGEWRECKLRWEVSNVDPFGTAVVVDGDQLLLTPLEKALVPPPMAAAAISLPCALADFVIGSNADGSEPLLVVILADESIAVYCGTDPAAASGIIPNYRPPAFTAKTKLPARARSWRSWCIIGDYSDGRVELLAVQAGSSYAADILVQMTLTWAAIADGPSEASLEVKREVLVATADFWVLPWHGARGRPPRKPGRVAQLEAEEAPDALPELRVAEHVVHAHGQEAVVRHRGAPAPLEVGAEARHEAHEVRAR